MDAVIFAVPHDEFKVIQLEDVKMMFGTTGYINLEVINEVAAAYKFDIKIDKKDCVLIDLKGMFNN